MVGIDRLKKISFLKDLSDEILEKIDGLTQLETMEKDAILLSQGQTQHLIYMLESGGISLSCKSASGKVLTLDSLCPGQTFGLSSFFEKTPATFTAACTEQSTVITLSADEMLSLFETDHGVGYKIMKRVVNKFKTRMNKHTQQFLHTLATHPSMGGGGMA